MLRQLEEVVTATGTQVLEMRECDDPYAHWYSVRGRQDAAILYLALGDAEGGPIRRLVWEPHGAIWQHTAYALKLSAANGLLRSEYEELRECVSCCLPAADDPDALAKVNAQRAVTSARGRPKAPWISHADICDLIDRRHPIPGQNRSDPVKDGGGGEPSGHRC
jgi:hypothetical protein